MSKLHTRTNVVNSLLWKLLERAGSQVLECARIWPGKDYPGATKIV